MESHAISLPRAATAQPRPASAVDARWDSFSWLYMAVLIVVSISPSLGALGTLVRVGCAAVGAGQPQGIVFGARLGVVATLTPLIAFGLLILSSIAVGSETCTPDCAQQAADYLYVAVLVASAAGILGLLRDRYFPRTA